MKIEIGESLMLSYLKHVKKCLFYQANWKVSSNFPIIQNDKTKLIDGEGHPRYWSNEMFGGRYYACSQWWKEKEEIYREKLSKWIKKIGEINKNR